MLTENTIQTVLLEKEKAAFHFFLQKVEKNNKDHYQFIILDINMPIMGGIEAY